MTPKSLSVIILSVAVLAACQPSAQSGSDPDLLLGDDYPVAPAEEALAATCTGDAALQAQMIDAVNGARAAEGKILLDANDQLLEMAQSHACDAAAMGRATVTGSNGSNVVDRARAVGYPTCGVAQLIAPGGSASEVVGNWLTSVPHRDELLGQTSEDIGVGVIRGAGGQIWWSVVLGNNCSGNRGRAPSQTVRTSVLFK